MNQEENELMESSDEDLMHFIYVKRVFFFGLIVFFTCIACAVVMIELFGGCWKMDKDNQFSEKDWIDFFKIIFVMAIFVLIIFVIYDMIDISTISNQHGEIILFTN